MISAGMIAMPKPMPVPGNWKNARTASKRLMPATIRATTRAHDCRPHRPRAVASQPIPAMIASQPQMPTDSTDGMSPNAPNQSNPRTRRPQNRYPNPASAEKNPMTETRTGGFRTNVPPSVGTAGSWGCPDARIIATCQGPWGSSPLDIDDVDHVGEALERLAPYLGCPMACPDRRRTGDDVAPAAKRRDPGRLVDALPVEIPADLCRIRGVQSDPDLRREAVGRAMLGEPSLDGDGRRDREIGRIEAHEEAVARRRDLLALMGGEDLTQRRVVPPQHRLPGLVAEGHDEIRRADDVGEHERLHDPPGRTGLAAQLPGQQLLGVLQHDRGGRARERRRAQDLLVDAVRPDDVGLAEVTGQPVERRRRERDAVARSDALVAIHARADGHQRDPTAASPRNASDVASDRLDAPS